MIKTVGIITLQDGVSQLNNPDINVYLCSPNKWAGAYGIAQAGKVIAATENQPESFQAITNVGGESGYWKVETPNPTFEQVQAVVLAELKKKYPTVTFEIV